MSYRLRYDRRFLRQLESLPGDVRSVARQQIKILAETPRPLVPKNEMSIQIFIACGCPEDIVWYGK